MWSKAVGCSVVLFTRKLLCTCERARATNANTVVPEGNVVLLPLKPDMDFLSRSDQLVQQMNNCICFCLWNANNFRHKA